MGTWKFNAAAVLLFAHWNILKMLNHAQLKSTNSATAFLAAENMIFHEPELSYKIQKQQEVMRSLLLYFPMDIYFTKTIFTVHSYFNIVYKFFCNASVKLLKTDVFFCQSLCG